MLPVMIAVNKSLGSALFFLQHLLNHLDEADHCCVSMQHCLILDHSTDIFHPGEFIDSTGKILSSMGCCYLYRQPWDVNLCTMHTALFCWTKQCASVPLFTALTKTFVAKTKSARESENDNLFDFRQDVKRRCKTLVAPQHNRLQFHSHCQCLM